MANTIMDHHGGVGYSTPWPIFLGSGIIIEGLSVLPCLSLSTLACLRSMSCYNTWELNIIR